MPETAVLARLSGHALPRGNIHAGRGKIRKSVMDMPMDYPLSPFRGEGKGEGQAYISARIVSNTAFVFCMTSLFQNRSKRNPFALSAFVRSSFIILHAFRVLSAVDFHNQLLFQTNEVNDVNSDGMLLSKFEFFKLAIAKEVPDLLLCFRGVCPEPLRARFQKLAPHGPRPPSPNLLPRGEKGFRQGYF